MKDAEVRGLAIGKFWFESTILQHLSPVIRGAHEEAVDGIEQNLGRKKVVPTLARHVFCESNARECTKRVDVGIF